MLLSYNVSITYHPKSLKRHLYKLCWIKKHFLQNIKNTVHYYHNLIMRIHAGLLVWYN